MIDFIKSEKFRNFIIVSAKWALIALIFVSILILNISTLVSPDDYNYSFVLGGAPYDKVDTIKDCIDTSKYLYEHWTGRLLPHVLVGLFRSAGDIYFEIANTIMFMVMLLLINKILDKKSTFLGIIVSFGFLVFSKMFGEKFAWMSGALNYLWPTTFLLIMIYFLYKYTFDEIKLNTVSKIAVALFAFLTAFMHENIAFVGGSFLLCLYLFNIKKIFSKGNRIFYISTFLLFCLGAAATIFAPGNLNRMGQENTTFSLACLGNYKNAKYHLLVVLISMVGVGCLKEKDLLKKEILFFILPAIIATIPMAIIANFPPRAFLPYEVLFMIILSKNVTVLAKKFEKYNVVIAIISVAFVLIAFRRYAPSTLAQIRYIIPHKYAVMNQIEEAAAKGEKEVLVSEFKYLDWIHREHYINIDNFFIEWRADMPINRYTAMYYHFDKVQAIGEDEYLIQLWVDTEGLNTYFVIDRTTGIQQHMMQYENQIEFTIPKEQLGNFVLNCKVNDVEDQILDYKVKYIGGELSKEEVSIDDLIEK